MVDQVANFKKVTVSTGYNNTATSIVLATGQGAELPDPSGDNYNVVWWDSTNYPDPADDPNVEIVRVTAKSTDTLTVTRNQEGSGASNKNNADATYKMILPTTAKTITDLIADVEKAATVIVGKSGHVDYLTTDYSDDCLAIHAAINYVDSIGGGNVFIREGIYGMGDVTGLLVNEGKYLFHEKENVSVFGTGRGTIINCTQQLAVPTGRSVFRFTNCENIEFHNIRFVGSQSDDITENQQNKSPMWIQFVTCQGIDVSHISCVDGIEVITVHDSDDVNISTFDIANHEHGFILSGASNRVNISNINHRQQARDARDGYVQTGIKFLNVSNVNVSNYNIQNNKREVFRIEGSTNLNFSNIHCAQTTYGYEYNGIFNVLSGENINIHGLTGVNTKHTIEASATLDDVLNINLSDAEIYNGNSLLKVPSTANTTDNISIRDSEFLFGENIFGMNIGEDAKITIDNCKIWGSLGVVGKAIYISCETNDIRLLNSNFWGTDGDFDKASSANSFRGMIVNCQFKDNDIRGVVSSFIGSDFEFKQFSGNWRGNSDSPTIYNTAIGSFTAPSVPATTVNYTNAYGYTCQVQVYGGTVTEIDIDDIATGLTSGIFIIPPGGTINITYSAAPSWRWWGL